MRSSAVRASGGRGRRGPGSAWRPCCAPSTWPPRSAWGRRRARVEPELRAVGVDQRHDLRGEVGAVGRPAGGRDAVARGGWRAAGAQADGGRAEAARRAVVIERRAKRGAWTVRRANVSAPWYPRLTPMRCAVQTRRRRRAPARQMDCSALARAATPSLPGGPRRAGPARCACRRGSSSARAARRRCGRSPARRRPRSSALNSSGCQ